MSNLTNGPYKIDLFISYNKEDFEFAEKLATRIEKEEYNGRKLRCFFDQWDIAPGENIVIKIEEALQNSKYIVMIVSPGWTHSNWTKLERSILIYDDPAGLKGKIIPVLRRNCDIPPSIRILNWLDFRTDSNFEREVSKLIARVLNINYRSFIKKSVDIENHIPITIDSIRPDSNSEIIVSNLFQIVQMPKYIYKSKTSVKKRSDIWNLFPEGTKLPKFALDEENHEIYSFTQLNNPQQKITSIIRENIQKIDVNELLYTKPSIIIEILNRSMTEHMENMGMIYDWKHGTKKTFFPLEKDNDESRYCKWRVGNREYKRILVIKTKSGKNYAHRSCKATFTKIGESLFLKIIPGWHFTIDGIDVPVSKDRMSSLSTKYMNIDRNHSILNDLRFWANKLSKDSEYINLTVSEEILVFIQTYPYIAEITKGIEEDYRERLWYEETLDMEDKEILTIDDEFEFVEEEEDAPEEVDEEE